MKKGLLSLLLLCLNTLGGELILDPSFTSPTLEKFGVVGMALAAADGKIIIAGPFNTVNGRPRQHLARLFPSGDLDTDFNPSNVELVDGLLPLPDGKLLLGGQITTAAGQTKRGVFRLLPDGSPDPAFSSALPRDGRGYRMAIDQNGRIYVQIADAPGLVRLEANGNLDNSFNIGTGFDDRIYSLATQADGKLLIGGYFNRFNGVDRPKLIRLNQDGTIDQSFTPDLAFWWDDIVFQIIVRPDGKIWVAGSLESVQLNDPPTYQGLRNRCIALLNSNGTKDPSFQNLSGSSGFVTSMAMLDDGTLVVQGQVYSFNDVRWGYSPVRIKASGELDQTYRPTRGLPVSAYRDGQVLLCHLDDADLSPTRVLRLGRDGSEDPAFRVLTGIPAGVTTCEQAADAKLLIGGEFQLVNSVLSPGLIRLQTNGIRDETFQIGTGPNGAVRTTAVLTNGDILVGGSFSAFNEKSAVGLVRLNTRGTLVNPSPVPFTIPRQGDFQPYPSVSKLVRTPGEKILLVGEFLSSAGWKLLQLNSDGDLDSSFQIDSTHVGLIQFIINSAIPVSDGSIIVGGAYSDCAYSDLPCFADGNFGELIRLNASGPFERLLIHGTAWSRSITVWANDGRGKSLISSSGGTFTDLQRVFADGSVDSTFPPIHLDSGELLAVIPLDDEFILAGSFQSANGTPSPYLARISSTGAVDPTFTLGSKFDGPIQGLLPQQNGDWVLFGSFQSVNGIPKSGVTRLRWEEIRIHADFQSSEKPAVVMKTLPGRTVILERSVDLKNWTPLATNLLTTSEWRANFNPESPQSFYRAKLTARVKLLE